MSTRRKTLANLNLPNLVDPSTYNFESVFMDLASQVERTKAQYLSLDVGLVLGLARSYARLLDLKSPQLMKERSLRGGTLVDSDTKL